MARLFAEISTQKNEPECSSYSCASPKRNIASTTPYYLLFGRQTDRTGVNTKIWVEVVLPENFVCFGENEHNGLLSYLSSILNHESPQLFDYINKEELAMEHTENLIKRLFHCCYAGLGNRKDGDIDPNLLNIIVSFDGEECSGDNAVAMIDITPKMPEISFRIEYNNQSLCLPPLTAKLKISYYRSPRSDEIESTLEEILVGMEYVFAFNSVDLWGITWKTIQGGRAEITIFDVFDVPIKSYTFSIKGINPTAWDVYTFCDGEPYNELWFLKKILTRESKTDSNQIIDHEMKQFNPYESSKEDLWSSWENYSRCPSKSTDGYSGWGLGQLTFSQRDQSLWDWKCNIHEAYDHITHLPENSDDYVGEVKILYNHWKNSDELKAIIKWNNIHNDVVSLNEDFGGYIWKAAITPLFEQFDKFKLAFTETLDENNEKEKSVLDACLIYGYNSSNPYYFNIIVPTDCEDPPCKPIIQTQDNSKHYVKKVLIESIPQY